jgi:L-threonylcarbamoyladenylate synthase
VKVFRSETLGDAAYDEIVALLHGGGIIAFPTDTAYGLAVDPSNDNAVDRLFQVKGRPETKPILLLVDCLQMAESIGEPVDIFYEVAERFWPGPLTLILKARASLPVKVTAGTHTIGIRWPVAVFATTLIDRFGRPITATSANRSGMPAAVTPDEVRAQLDDAVDAVVDGGTLATRMGSTVLDLTVDPPMVLREGPITFEMLNQFFKGRLQKFPA